MNILAKRANNKCNFSESVTSKVEPTKSKDSGSKDGRGRGDRGRGKLIQVSLINRKNLSFPVVINLLI